MEGWPTWGAEGKETKYVQYSIPACTAHSFHPLEPSLLCSVAMPSVEIPHKVNGCFLRGSELCPTRVFLL